MGHGISNLASGVGQSFLYRRERVGHAFFINHISKCSSPPPPPPILFDQSLSYVYIELQAQILGEHVFLTFHCYLIVSHVFHQYILRRKHY